MDSYSFPFPQSLTVMIELEMGDILALYKIIAINSTFFL
jgi:hypothetical protein